MVTIQLTPRQVLGYIIAGIKNGRYQEALNLAQDCIDEMDAQSKTNQALDSDGKKQPRKCDDEIQPKDAADEEKLCKICGQGPEVDHNNCMIMAMHR